MASFRSHVSLGIASGILGIVAFIFITTLDTPHLLLAVFVAAVLGSVLPDIDSDSGIPFHVSFGSFAIVAAVLVGMSAYQETPEDFPHILIWVVGAFGFVYIILGNIFKYFTRHRGMAHSLPAALLAGLSVFFAAAYFTFSDMEAFVLAVAMMTGYSATSCWMSSTRWSISMAHHSSQTRRSGVL